MTFDVLFIYFNAVVTQAYEANVGVDYAIRGNSVVVKCGIPSFVADFVQVISWHTDKGDDVYPTEDYGINFQCPQENPHSHPFIPFVLPLIFEFFVCSRSTVLRCERFSGKRH